MGLDMYLRKGKKIPKIPFDRYKEIDNEIGSLSETPKSKRYKEKYKDYIHECGVNIKWYSLFEEVGYWRKANHIHKWFVDNVQNGVDNCDMYLVSKEHLEKLLDTCIKVINSTRLVKSQVYMGTSWSRENGQRDNYEDGYVLENNGVAKELLPRECGFFFGGEHYDQFYYEDILETIKVCLHLLKWTNFDNEYIVYQSSW